MDGMDIGQSREDEKQWKKSWHDDMELLTRMLAQNYVLAYV